MNARARSGLVTALWIAAASVQAGLVGTPARFPSRPSLTAVALDVGARRLYCLAKAHGEVPACLTVYSLDTSGTPSESFDVFPCCEQPAAVALEPVRRRLYVLGSAPPDNLCVFELEEDGDPVAGHRSYTVGKAPKAFALDPARGKLYIADDAQGESNLYLSDLDEEGYPAGAPRSYPSGARLVALALDPVRNKLYVGKDDYYKRANDLDVYDLDESGDPAGAPRAYTVGICARAFALDPARDRLYVANHFLSDFTLFVCALDAEGCPVGVPTSFRGPWYPLCMCLDAAGGQLFIGGASRDLYGHELDENGNPSGEPAIVPISGFSGLAVDAARNRLYAVRDAPGERNLYVFEIGGPTSRRMTRRP